MRRRKKIFSIRGLIPGVLLLAGAFLATSRTAGGTYRSLPEFTQKSSSAWINSKPLRVGDLRGRVVLLDVWTLVCWNCYRSFPWLLSLEKKLKKKKFTVIGIHSPEFSYERSRKLVVKKVKHFKLKHPVMMDNNYAYWKALKNRYWPTFYIVDKKGRIRGVFAGETHSGDDRARAMEGLILKLLAE